MSPVNRQNVIHLRRLGKIVWVGEVVGFFETFVSEPEDIQAGFVAVTRLACAHFLIFVQLILTPNPFSSIENEEFAHRIINH
jgi:hypothetical protein